jgi:basic membrane lipoprotein Med (substrate-binding protein (PBP1-ABC) superfamily)
LTLRLSRRAVAGGIGLAALGLGGSRLGADEPLKIGMALDAAVTEVGWTKQHSLAAAAVQQALGDRVVFSIVDTIFQPQDAERVFRGFAGSGHRLIFGTSFSHGAPIAKVAAQFPRIAFDNCAGIKLLPNLGAFEAKYYEGAFLAGVIAGSVSKTGKLGFLGGFPIPDIVGPGNALLLGAQSVRRDATCSVIFLNSWSDPGKEKDAARALAAQGCDVLAAMTDSPAAVQAAEEAGIWSIGYASDMRRFAPTRQLTSLVLDWSSIYRRDVEAVLAGQFTGQSRWQGLADGVVRLAALNDAVPADLQRLVASRQAAIIAGQLQPYGGELRDQSGAVRVARGAVLSDAEVRGMNWLVAGMQGRLG